MCASVYSLQCNNQTNIWNKLIFTKYRWFCVYAILTNTCEVLHPSITNNWFHKHIWNSFADRMKKYMLIYETFNQQSEFYQRIWQSNAVFTIIPFSREWKVISPFMSPKTGNEGFFLLLTAKPGTCYSPNSLVGFQFIYYFRLGPFVNSFDRGILPCTY